MPALRVTAFRALTGALLVAALSLPACGGDAAPAPPQQFGSERDLQSFTCADWQRAGAAQRRAVLDALRGIIGGQVTGGGVAGRGTVLDDDIAYRLFDGHCRQSYARHFVLYKLYGQAAGFAGVAP